MGSNLPMTNDELLITVYGTTQIAKGLDDDNPDGEPDISCPVEKFLIKASGQELPVIELKKSTAPPAAPRVDMADEFPLAQEDFFAYAKCGMADALFRKEAPVAKPTLTDEQRAEIISKLEEKFADTGTLLAKLMIFAVKKGRTQVAAMAEKMILANQEAA